MGLNGFIMNQYPPSLQHLSLLTAKEAAGYLHISLSTLYRMEQKGLITPKRTPGGHRRYSIEMLDECLASSPSRLERELPK